jgi:hypothetical protein
LTGTAFGAYTVRSVQRTVAFNSISSPRTKEAVIDTATITPASPASAGTSHPQPDRRRWVVAAVVLAAAVMDLLDATIVNVAGPSIHRDLGGSAATAPTMPCSSPSAPCRAASGR